MKRSFDSLVQILPTFALVFRFKQFVSRLIAKIFGNSPNQESRYRRLKVCGGFCLFGIVRLAGHVEWISADHTKF
jgi:hypothetical protein